MRVAIGSDHAGFELKKKVIDLLSKLGHEIADQGSFTTDSVDYPDLAAAVAESVQRGEAARGILMCGTGIGMSIVANKFRGVRAAVCHDVQTAILSRQHNDANVLTMAGRGFDHELAVKMVEEWMRADFLGDRHGRRVDKIRKIEENNCR
jgi:ribose 5-phosphate isomerase B